MRFPAARTMNPSSASGDSTKMAAANTMAATRTLTVVRWVLVAWAVIDFGGVLVVPPLPEDLIREAIILGLSWMIVLLSTYRVKWAALAGAVLIVVSSLTGSILPAVNVFIFVPVAVCAFSTWPVLSVTVASYVVLGVAGQAYGGQEGRHTTMLFILLLGFSLVGLAIRVLVARSRWTGRQIRSLEDAATQLRESERQALAGELTGLLSKELADQRECLENARDETAPEALSQLLDGTARGARAALSQLRGLVQTLRGRKGESAPVEASVGLVEAAESVDDLLTGHGFWVAIDTSRISRSPGAATSRLLGELVRAAGACVLAHAQPGGQCELSVFSDDGETHIRFVSAGVADSYDLSQARQRIEAMGGSVQMMRGGGVYASMPFSPADDGGDQPGEPRVWDVDAGVRVALTMVLVAVALVVAVPSSSSYSHGSDFIWGIFSVGLALCLWWPLWGGVLVATVFVASMWIQEPTVVAGISNLPFVVLTAMVTVYWPRWVWVFLLLGVVRFGIWFGEVNVDLAFVTIIYGGIGILAGLAARYFLLLRARQHSEFTEATAEREDARGRVRLELAGELHDIVAHQLTLLALNVDAHRGETDPLLLRAALDRADSILASAQADLAFLLYVLRTPGGNTPEDGLLRTTAAVEAAAAALRTSGRSVDVALDCAVDDADPTTSRTLARVVREASTNILRYAPKHAECAISIERDTEEIRVMVRSELPSEAGSAGARRAADSTGLGLTGLSERLKLTGGWLSAGEQDGEWVVKAQLPLAPA